MAVGGVELGRLDAVGGPPVRRAEDVGGHGGGAAAEGVAVGHGPIRFVVDVGLLPAGCPASGPEGSGADGQNIIVREKSIIGRGAGIYNVRSFLFFRRGFAKDLRYGTAGVSRWGILRRRSIFRRRGFFWGCVLIRGRGIFALVRNGSL